MLHTTRRKVLIVDDDAGVTRTFARMLSLEGYEVHVAFDGQEGLRETAAATPDAILLDLRMPLIDGINFLRELRAGTYIFEVPSPDASPDIVRVMSRDRKTVYFTAFTRSIDRPKTTPMTQFVTTREVAKDVPVPIAVWWSDARTGRQFIYQ